MSSLLLRLIAAGSIVQFSKALEVIKEEINVDSLPRTYYVQYPKASMPESGWPVVFSFHGFGSSASGMAWGDGLRALGARHAVIVHPEGHSDESWNEQSWNGGGSAGTGGSDGLTCKEDVVVATWQTRCFKSCKQRNICNDHCRWSHCEDDIAFVVAMVDSLRKKTKLDDNRIYATGHSNGGVFIYELATDPRTASIFSAIAPAAGLPHNGFNRGTITGKTRLLAILGTKDTYVYGLPNVAEDRTKSYGDAFGWYYSNWENTTNLWARQRDLELSKRSSLLSGHPMFSCHGWSPDDTAEHAEAGACFYDGPHNSPSESYTVVWRFFGFRFPDQSQCLKTCGGSDGKKYGCDDWLEWNPDKYTCDSLEKEWNCDCSGCSHCTLFPPTAGSDRVVVGLVVSAVAVLVWMGMKPSKKTAPAEKEKAT